MPGIRVRNESIDDVRLVIFDRDGTLINIYQYWSWMLEKRSERICRHFALDTIHVAGLMDAMGIDLANKKIKRAGPVGIKKREIVMQAAIEYLRTYGITESYDACMKAFAEVDGLSKNHLQDIIKPLPSLHTLFDALKRHGIKIAIATTDKAVRARMTMDHLGLSRDIDCIIGADSVAHPKPAPDMIEHIVNDLGVAKANAVMVGDAIEDVEMGVNAGVKASIGVCSGITDRELLMTKTKYIAESIADIIVYGEE